MFSLYKYDVKLTFLNSLTNTMQCRYFANRTVELGGIAAQTLMGGSSVGAFAGHTTCYEHYTKVMGLKAVNAFWNPLYYDPHRPTITKQLVYTDGLTLLDDLRSLVWLAFATNRSIIIPNVLGKDEFLSMVGGFGGKTLWPGFRVLKFKKEVSMLTSILEPGFYWRVNRDYAPVPEPKIVYYNPKIQDVEDIRKVVAAAEKFPRVVLHPMVLPKFLMDHASSNLEEGNDLLSNSKRKELNTLVNGIADDIRRWSIDSVGVFAGHYFQEERAYQPLPSVKGLRVMQSNHWRGDTGGLRAYNSMLNDWAVPEIYLSETPQAERVRGRNSAENLLQGMRLCMHMFKLVNGNRSCFDKCR